VPTRNPAHALRPAALILLLAGAGAAGAQATQPLCRDPGEGTLPPPGLEAGVDQVSVLAEEAELREVGPTTVSGRVVLRRGPRTVAADSITFYREADLIDALDGIRVWDDQTYAHAAEGQLDLATDQVWLRDVHYRLREERGRGNAESVQVDRSGRALIEHGSYSTCDPGADEWVLSAREITLDREGDVGTARDVTVRFLGAPLFYTPWLSFPLSGARKSGVLPPTAGSSSSTGIEATVPYYWNIAPERDATLGARVTTKRGVALDGEYRYLMPMGKGDVQLEYLPNDPEYGDSRNLARLRHSQTFEALSRSWWTSVDASNASDADYLKDLGTNLDVTSTQFLERRADLGTGGDLWSVLGRVQDYQTVDRGIARVARPYGRLPQVLLSAGTPTRYRGLALGLRGEAVRFAQSERVQGDRVDLMPSVSYPLRSAATFLVPRASLRYTGYGLEDAAPGTDGDPRPPGSTDDPARTVPLFSLDAGAFFERELGYRGRPLLQTLEPRAYYLYVPYRDQDDIPVFDTALYSFSFYQLFRENRFSGTDRVGDANQLTLALTSRLADASTGAELARVSVGGIQYFADRRVQLPGTPTETGDSSDLVAEVAALIGPSWQARTSWQWDTGDGETEKLAVAARYQPDRGRLVNLGYLYLRDDLTNANGLDQTDVSFRWTLGRQWSVVGRWNQEVPGSQLIDAFAGIEYERCCWGVRAVARRFLTGEDEEYATGFFIQLELKGLGGFGGDTVEFLREQIPGYDNYF
jgi:LPS-assembly protein